VENLYFAGRNISMTHTAMSSIRVMATCALLGEAVGKAAAVAVQNAMTPHGVYRERMADVQEKLMNEDCFLPRMTRSVSDACLSAALTGAPDSIRDGRDRPHALYGTENGEGTYHAPIGEEIAYRFDAQTVSAVHLVFDSDLDRETLPGSQCERIHTTRANRRLDSPQMHMPKTLCRAFTLFGEREGKREVLLQITDNRRRAYHLPVNGVFDALILLPEDVWCENAQNAPLISFDFA
jgi:hypothetical protein